jgi:hypothetical protein
MTEQQAPIGELRAHYERQVLSLRDTGGLLGDELAKAEERLYADFMVALGQILVNTRQMANVKRRQTVNICQNDSARVVRMKTVERQKCLKTLERVKGIEPSYSAWKGFGG